MKGIVAGVLYTKEVCKMNASLAQHIMDLMTAALTRNEAIPPIEDDEIFSWRVLGWVPDQPLTPEEQEKLIEPIPTYMAPAGIAAAAFNEEKTALNIFVCQTTFPASIHRDTAMWLCAQGVLEYASNELSQTGLVFISDEIADPNSWQDVRPTARDLSEWWSIASPIDSTDGRAHRAKLQTYIKRRQFSMLGGYISRVLRNAQEINRCCFGFVPLTIEAVWNQHPELSLQELTEGLSLREMSRKPRETLLNWIGMLPSLLKSHPALTNSEPVERVIESIRANCALPYSQANLSRSLGLTPAYFCRLFHDKAGMHFSTFLTNTRMEKARELLSQEEVPSLQELSLACGYPNKSYFCQVFKKHTGMTPGEYEQMMKKENK